jgi:hypothetical protein
MKVVVSQYLEGVADFDVAMNIGGSQLFEEPASDTQPESSVAPAMKTIAAQPTQQPVLTNVSCAPDRCSPNIGWLMLKLLRS